jgi:hemerythrin-like domain-containing protein
MKTSEILSEEHKNILEVINALEQESGLLRSGKEIDKEFFLKIIDFIRNYADKFHHAKEEDILFREFCKAVERGEMHCNPVEQMLHEHDLGRNFVKEMEQGVKENNQKKVIENAEGYSQLLKEHIFKEDSILYPMADEALSSKIEAKMVEEFKIVEEKKKRDKEKYLTFVKELKGGENGK